MTTPFKPQQQQQQQEVEQEGSPLLSKVSSKAMMKRYESAVSIRSVVTETETDAEEELESEYNDPSHQDELESLVQTAADLHASRILYSFVTVALLFASNHGCTAACLGLATARLGNHVGAWQSGILFLSFTFAAMSGLATHLVEKKGARDTMIWGMAGCTVYVAVFAVASHWPAYAETAALLGAAMGGIGLGCLWTGQGVYFAQASKRHASAKWGADAVTDAHTSESTALFAGIFAALYLGLEVLLRLLSSFLIETHRFTWSQVFVIYVSVTIVSAFGMMLVDSMEDERVDTSTILQQVGISTKKSSRFYAAIKLLVEDPRMLHLAGMTSLFGLVSAYQNTYINGLVVGEVLSDTTTTTTTHGEVTTSHHDSAKYVGMLTAWLACVASVMSLVMGQMASQKDLVLRVGTVCAMVEALCFVVYPDLDQWNLTAVVVVYTLAGIARATYEGPVKAVFADFFYDDKEGAFANVVLQNGLASAIGYFASGFLTCSDARATYCIEYDGIRQDTLTFPVVVGVAGIWALAGHWRACAIHKDMQTQAAAATSEPLEIIV